MHDKPAARVDPAPPPAGPIDSLIDELAAADPAAAPDIADQVVQRLESDLTGASERPADPGDQ